MITINTFMIFMVYLVVRKTYWAIFFPCYGLAYWMFLTLYLLFSDDDIIYLTERTKGDFEIEIFEHITNVVSHFLNCYNFSNFVLRGMRLKIGRGV